ncbi:MAG: agmatine deiminase family protein, partial [Bacteroidales bacterium]
MHCSTKPHTSGQRSIQRTILTSILLILGLPLTLAFQHERHTDVPVNPTTIPEYDSVAGVVMYWNPYNNPAYDQIATAVIEHIQPRATVFMQTNNQTHEMDMINNLEDHDVTISDIVFIDVYGDRIWIRDHGPFSIYDNDTLAFVGFDDLATGHGDQDLPERLAGFWELNYYDFSHIIFDGGNYLVDNHNRLFATQR